MTRADDELEPLFQRAAAGDAAARQELLLLHEGRLRQMVAVRLDRRLAARLDVADVVQDVLALAHQHLDDYLRTRPLPFYPWLRRLAWQRLVKLRQRHLGAAKRSALREEHGEPDLSDASVQALAQRLFAAGSTPSQHLLREELRRRVQDALARLGERDREVIVLRYLEQLSTREIAAVLDISEGAVKVRHLRALDRLRRLLGDDIGEDTP